MIPKVKNYKEVLLYSEPEIYNDNFTMFKSSYLNTFRKYPYLETIIDHSNRYEYFDKFNNLYRKSFLENMEIISTNILDNLNHFYIERDRKIVAYMIFDCEFNLIKFDCLPKYQRQGLFGVIMRFILKSGSKITIKPLSDDHKILQRLILSPPKFEFCYSKVKVELIDEIMSLEVKDRNSMIMLEYEIDKLSIIKKYSNHGLLAYTESYDYWFY